MTDFALAWDSSYRKLSKLPLIQIKRPLAPAAERAEVSAPVSFSSSSSSPSSCAPEYRALP
jgi:uncharacterized ParB-like nuclease family protein